MFFYFFSSFFFIPIYFHSFSFFSCVNTCTFFRRLFASYLFPFLLSFPTSYFSCLSSSSVITSTFFLENVTTRRTRASAESSSAGEGENGNDRKNGRRGARDHECANERMPACERGMKGKEEKEERRRVSLSRLFQCSFRRSVIWGRALERLFANSNGGA